MYKIIEELLQNLYYFGQKNLTPSGTCALFTVTIDTHVYNTTQDKMTLDELQRFTADKLSAYAFELPRCTRPRSRSQSLRNVGRFLRTT